MFIGSQKEYVASKLISTKKRITMNYKPKILCFASSLRQDSYNKKLVKVAMRAAENAGEVKYIDLNDYPLPIYQEIEEKDGLPSNALKLRNFCGKVTDLLLHLLNTTVPFPEY